MKIKLILTGMDINGWLTVITILSAILGYLIQDELRILISKIGNRDKWILFIILLIVIPCLLVFKPLQSKYLLFNKEPFAFNWGWDSGLIALMVFILSLFYVIYLVSIKKYYKINRRIIDNYISILEEKPSVFWRIFEKYENPDFIEKNWEKYNDLIFHQHFLKSAIQYHSPSNFVSGLKKIRVFNPNKIKNYIYLLSENQLETFIRVFEKFDDYKVVKENWKVYKRIFTDKKLLAFLVEKYPSILLKIWKFIDNQEDYKIFFHAFTDNKNSDYYREIKEFDKNEEGFEQTPFLKILISEKLKQTIDNGIFLLISDIIHNDLRNENSSTSIYNQVHYKPKGENEEGWDLPAYYHICFIKYLYNYAINQNFKIDELSNKYTNMSSIYSNMVSLMVQNLIVDEKDLINNVQKNYHLLIKEVFDFQSNWLRLFIENYEISNTYNTFIPISISLCNVELLDGYKSKKFSETFIQEQHNKVLSYYYKSNLPNALKYSIEQNVIAKIPQEFIKLIFENSIKEKFAVLWYYFEKNNLESSLTLKDSEKEIIQRLYDFLKKENKL